MRVGIFYISKSHHGTQLGDTSVTLPTSVGFVLIRMEEVEADDLCAALDLAAPRDGESVMNTHEL